MKKLNKILGITIIFMFALTVAVSATNSLGLDIKASKEKLNIKDEVIITLSASDINVGEDGINTIETVVNYNKAVFEEISSEQIVSDTDWTIIYNKENGKLLAINFNGDVNTKQDLFKITLKVKEDVYGTKNEEIKLLNVTTNDEKEIIEAGTKAVKVQITGKEEANNNAVEDNTTAKGTIPNTGVKSILTIIGIVAIVSVVVFIRNRKLEKDLK